MDRFSTKQEIVLRLEALREASATLAKAVKATMFVVRKYDGKEFTRRITNEAQKAVDAVLGAGVVFVGFERENGHRGINFSLVNRSYFVPRTRFGREVSDVVYFDSELCARLADWTVSSYYAPVDASRFQVIAGQMVAYNARLVYQYADAVEHFDEYRTAYDDAVRALQEACGAINPLFLDRTVDTRNTRVSRAWEERAEQALSNTNTENV